MLCLLLCYFFFFYQKTSYDLRISDWSSDVCSSDLALTVLIALAVAVRLVRPVNELVGAALRVSEGDLAVRVPEPRTRDEVGSLGTAFNVMTARLETQTTALESRRALIAIGRASCRERVCQYV